MFKTKQPIKNENIFSTRKIIFLNNTELTVTRTFCVLWGFSFCNRIFKAEKWFNSKWIHI